LQKNHPEGGFFVSAVARSLLFENSNDAAPSPSLQLYVFRACDAAVPDDAFFDNAAKCFWRTPLGLNASFLHLRLQLFVVQGFRVVAMGKPSQQIDGPQASCASLWASGTL